MNSFRSNVEDKKFYEKYKRSRLEERTINQDIDLSHFRIVKPSMFQTYKQKVEDLGRMESKAIIGQSFDLISMVRTVRGIFDSKWNEFSMYEDKNAYSRFSDFVYSWLGNYEIDMVHSRVIKIEFSSKNIFVICRRH